MREALTYLFVINSFGAGGAERSLADLLPVLRASGITPVIACLKEKDVGFRTEVVEAGFDVRLLSGRNLLSKARSLRGVIREIDPELVYTALFDADIVGRLASAGFQVPVITNLTNTAYDPARLDDPNVSVAKLKVVKLIDGITARMLSDRFHAVSHAVKDSMVDALGIDPDRVVVIHRGRDADAITVAPPDRKTAAKNALGIGSDNLVVVTVGRQEYQKGQAHLVRAFRHVHDALPNAKLVIAGREGHATDSLSQAISDEGLAEHVVVLGHRADVADVLSTAEVFAFPSVYEGLGGALIEAMAAGLPVVASDIPALREVVELQGNAILVPPADPDALADALIDLLRDTDRRAQYSVRSRELFEQRFTAAMASKRLLDYLAEVAAG